MSCYISKSHTPLLSFNYRAHHRAHINSLSAHSKENKESKEHCISSIEPHTLNPARCYILAHHKESQAHHHIAAGQLKLYNVEPKTAAMVMAIVADKMGKPINELRFLSIKEVD